MFNPIKKISDAYQEWKERREMCQYNAGWNWARGLRQCGVSIGNVEKQLDSRKTTKAFRFGAMAALFKCH